MEIENDRNLNAPELHGISLEKVMDLLIEKYGFEELSKLIRINCFKSYPSKESSLKFLRKTQWARLQVQGLYVRAIRENKKKEKQDLQNIN
ncbi:MAG: VF530 family DNA-binding protein [Candidatus Gracilibacteria bacterium]|nr:VF530 family DNA-binding protein [Candidatus Gracilibacteria bacterium]